MRLHVKRHSACKAFADMCIGGTKLRLKSGTAKKTAATYWVFNLSTQYLTGKHPPACIIRLTARHYDTALHPPCGEARNRLTSSKLQKAVFCSVKDGLSPRNSWSFARRLTAFHQTGNYSRTGRVLLNGISPCSIFLACPVNQR